MFDSIYALFLIGLFILALWALTVLWLIGYLIYNKITKNHVRVKTFTRKSNHDFTSCKTDLIERYGKDKIIDTHSVFLKNETKLLGIIVYRR
jgi:hypothetical protein